MTTKPNTAYQLLARILFPFVAVALIWLSIEAARSAYQYQDQARVVSNYLDSSQANNIVLDRVIETVSLGLLTPHSEWLKQLQTHRDTMTQAQQRATKLALYWAVTLLAWIAISILAQAPNIPLRQRLGSALALSSVPALTLGLSTPLLMISAQKQLPVVGEVVLKFESKGIVSTITSLWNHNNASVAIIIALVSVLLPALKTLALLGVSLARSRPRFTRLFHWLHHIGKWSMADVFVVSLLLTFLATDDQELTRASLQTGFYFFLSYVLLSLIASQLLKTANATAS